MTDIYCLGSSNNFLFTNLAQENEDHGFLLDGAEANTLEDNTSDSNLGNGFHASSGSVGNGFEACSAVSNSGFGMVDETVGTGTMS